MIRTVARVIDERTGAAPAAKKALRYPFPDHWSFLLGEVALYAFIVLVATGVYLTFFFEPSTAHTTIYRGSYEPLQGLQVTDAYRSVVDISFDVKAGLLIRQTHHWAADVFVAAILLHLIRIFFTGAYRKPRELTYVVGLLMLMLSLLEGYLGYSMIDDLLSGMGLAIGYAVALSVPFLGANLVELIWGGPLPGEPEFWSRIYIAHVLILPLIIGGLIAVHLALVASRHHTQFRRTPAHTEGRVVGVPAFPGQVPRSLALFFATAAALVLLGGLVQINPIWLWGPYHVADATNGAQPDWYLGWLIGALRLVPSFDLVIGDRTAVPNPFWGGALFPLVIFAGLFAWPWIERRLTGDRAPHNVLQRPRDAPTRTAIGCAVLSLVFVVFLAGSTDRVTVMTGLSYAAQIWTYRVLAIVLPPLVFIAAKRFCRALLELEEIRKDRERAEEEGRAAALRAQASRDPETPSLRRP